jgi:hypothetical protein
MSSVASSYWRSAPSASTVSGIDSSAGSPFSDSTAVVWHRPPLACKHPGSSAFGARHVRSGAPVPRLSTESHRSPRGAVHAPTGLHGRREPKASQGTGAARGRSPARFSPAAVAGRHRACRRLLSRSARACIHIGCDRRPGTSCEGSRRCPRFARRAPPTSPSMASRSRSVG